MTKKMRSKTKRKMKISRVRDPYCLKVITNFHRKAISKRTKNLSHYDALEPHRKLKAISKKLKMNTLVRNVTKLIIPNGFFYVILAIRAGIAYALGQLLCLYLRAIGFVHRASITCW